MEYGAETAREHEAAAQSVVAGKANPTLEAAGHDAAHQCERDEHGLRQIADRRHDLGQDLSSRHGSSRTNKFFVGKDHHGLDGVEVCW